MLQNDQVAAQRFTSEEKRALERSQVDVYSDFRRAAEAHRYCTVHVLFVHHYLCLCSRLFSGVDYSTVHPVIHVVCMLIVTSKPKIFIPLFYNVPYLFVTQPFTCYMYHLMGMQFISKGAFKSACLSDLLSEFKLVLIFVFG